MGTHIEEGTLYSTFTCEEYIVAGAVLADDADDCRHVALEFQDTGILDLGLDRDSGLLKKVVLVLCGHVHDCSGRLSVPEAPGCKLFFDLPRECACDTFETTVYDDGMRIRLSTKRAEAFVACGKLVFGLESKGDISELYFTGLTPEEVKHIRREIRFAAEE